MVASMEPIGLALVGSGITAVAFLIAGKLLRLDEAESVAKVSASHPQVPALKFDSLALGFSTVAIAIVGLAVVTIRQGDNVSGLRAQFRIQETVARMAELQELGTPAMMVAAAEVKRSPAVESELQGLQTELLNFRKQVGTLPAEAYFQLGIAAAAERRTDDAISYFKKTTELDPYNARAFTSLGVLYYFKGEDAPSGEEKMRYNEEAIKFHRRAVEISPNFAKARSNLGISLYIVGRISGDQQKINEAIEEEKRAIAIEPNYSEAYYNLACIYSLEGEKEQALKWLALAIDHGYTALGELRGDKDLNNIRTTQEYKRLEALLTSRLGLTE